jgi:hypothetical protein
MSKKIYIVGGCKGGVGKSVVTMAFIDYLVRTRQEEVYLVESDTSNPDVGRACFKPVDDSPFLPGEALDLDDSEGWINLVNAAGHNPGAHIVVNTAARNDKGVGAYGSLLSESLQDLDRDVVTFWVINRQKDSLDLCDTYLKAVPFGTTHVVINGYFGERKKFQLYDDSQVRQEIEEKGQTLYFPDLADRVADMMRNESLTVSEAEKTLNIGERAELRRWRNECGKMFSAVFADGGKQEL